MRVGTTVERTTRYTLVGAVCAIAYNIIMIFGSWLGGGYISLSALAFVVVVPIAYLLHARFTFEVGRSWRDFARFASGIAASYPICFAVLAILCSGLHLIIPVAAPIATVVMYVLNYIMSHWAMRTRLPFWPVKSSHECPAGFEQIDAKNSDPELVQHAQGSAFVME